MNDSDRIDRIAGLLDQIRVNQVLQQQGQSDALALQSQQPAPVRQQNRCASGIQDRAERPQSP